MFVAPRYFEAAHPSSTERNIYSVAIPSRSTSETTEPIALTDTSVPSFYTADFSPKGGFFRLSYRGPNVPWQKVIQVGNEGRYQGTSFCSEINVACRFQHCADKKHCPERDVENV
jgi:hypothetical protein